MSETFRLQSADGLVGIRGPNQTFHAISNATPPRYNAAGVPQNGVSGFIPSAIVQNPLGTLGSLIYINTGTVTSANWVNLL